MSDNGIQPEIRVPLGFRLPSFYDLIEKDVTGSTNDDVRQLAMANAKAGSVVLAYRQEGGRGRRGRTWVSEPGNMFCSILLRPKMDPATASKFSFVAALCVVEAIKSIIPDHLDADVRCKWPNDVLINGRKVAGILLECQAGAMIGDQAAQVDWLVLGIGINVSHHPVENQYPATSLALELGARRETTGETIGQLLNGICERLSHWQQTWDRVGFSAIRYEWLANARGVGEPVIARLGNGDEITGTFLGLDDSGAMILETATERRKITAGDIFFP